MSKTFVLTVEETIARTYKVEAESLAEAMAAAINDDGGETLEYAVTDRDFLVALADGEPLRQEEIDDATALVER